MKRTKIQIDLGARVLMIITALALFLPTLVISLRPDGQLVTQHRRDLAAWPETATLASTPQLYFKQIELWHRDYVGFSVRAGRAYRQFSYYALGDAAVNNIERGPGNFVFLASHQPDRSFKSISDSCPPTQNWRDIVSMADEDWREIHSALQRHDLDPVLLLIPSKKTLYPEYLPTTIPRDLRDRCLAMRRDNRPIAELARLHPQSVIDTKPIFAPLKDRPHFYPPENFHADGESAYHAAEAAVRQIYDLPTNALIDDFKFVQANADLTTVLGFNRTIMLGEPVGFDKISFHPDPDHLRQIRAQLGVPVYAKAYDNPEAPIDQDILLIANSFGARIAPYISRYVKSVRLIQTNAIVSAEDVQRFFRTFVFDTPPDQVIFVFHDESVFQNRLNKYATALRAIDE